MVVVLKFDTVLKYFFLISWHFCCFRASFFDSRSKGRMISEFVAIKMFGGKQKQNDELAKNWKKKEQHGFKPVS